MKLFRRNNQNAEPIYGMSVKREFLIGKLQGYAEVIKEHILKIVTANLTGNGKFIDKWIGDIAKAVFNASKYTTY